MEDLLGLLIYAMVHWRFALAVVIAIVVGVVLVYLIPALTAAFAVVLACCGAGVGLLWESSASSRR